MAEQTQHTKTRHNEQRHLLFRVLVSQSKKDLALKPAGETWLGGVCIPELLRPHLAAYGGLCFSGVLGNPSPRLSALRPTELNALEDHSVLSLSNSSPGWLRDRREFQGFWAGEQNNK